MSGLMLGKYIDGVGQVRFIEVAVDVDGRVLMAGASPLTDAQMRASAVLVTAGQITTVTPIIAAGQSLSGGIDLGLMRIVRIVMPGTWAAAKVSFEVSHDGVTYKPFYGDDDQEVTVNPPAGVEREMSFSQWVGVRFLKIRSGIATAPVVQATAQSIILVLVP